MTPAALRKFCLSLPGATEQVQWHDDLVFKVGGKMFAVSGLEKDSSYSFKVEKERFLEFTDLDGITPAPYLARAQWIKVDPDECRLPAAEIRRLVGRSYELVFGKLPKKIQSAIAGEAG